MDQNQWPDLAAMSNDVRGKAEKRASERIALLSHLGSFVIINAFLVLIWALAGRGYPWFLWVNGGMGSGPGHARLRLLHGTQGRGQKGTHAQERNGEDPKRAGLKRFRAQPLLARLPGMVMVFT